MSNTNSYFQLFRTNEGLVIKIYPAEEGGKNITYDEITAYLEKNQISGFDIGALGRAVNLSINAKAEATISLNAGYSINEMAIIRYEDNNMRAIARFYPPTNDGQLIDKAEILSDISNAGIKNGLKEDVIDKFLADRQYCTDYIIAEGQYPRQGKNAEIKYYFNTDRRIKPKKNEDGSVDFHQLDNISHINEGDVLAELFPADAGDPGVDVFGNRVNPYKVERKTLKHGNNIHLTEDGLKMISDVNGHATLEGEKVFVSNVYEVPADVDNSTGDISYEGSVVVKGNVRTGFKIRCSGDVEVHGAVEGAEIVAGGQIVLHHGIQGMSRGLLVSKGNIIAKFIESARVSSQGYIEAAAIIQSQVSAKGEINVMGSKGNIIGGHVRSASSVSAKTIGSPMGIMTTVEVGVDPVVKEQVDNLNKQMEEKNNSYKKLEQIVAILNAKLKLNQLTADKVALLKKSLSDMNVTKEEMMDIQEKIDKLTPELAGNPNSFIAVSQEIHSGAKIVVGGETKFINEDLAHCKFVKRDGDVNSSPL